MFLCFHLTYSQNENLLGSSELNEKSIIQRLNYIKKNNNSISLPEQEKLLLQIIDSAKKINFENGALEGYSLLMKAYDKQNKNVEIVELDDQIKKLIQNRKEDPTGILSDIYRKRALALGYLGLDTASMVDFKKSLSFAKTIKDFDKKQFMLSMSYENLTVYFNNSKRFEDKKNRDSVVYYLNKAAEAVKLIGNNSKSITDNRKYDHLGFIYMRLGIFYLEQVEKKGSLELAEKYLLEGLKIYENKKYHIPGNNVVMMQNQMSWLYMEKGEYQKSIDFAERALALEKQHVDPYHRVESFEFLATSYLEVGDKKKSKFYMQEYSALKDSIGLLQKSDGDKTIGKLVNNIESEHQENSNKQLLGFGIFLFIVAILVVFLWKRKKDKLRKNYEQIIEKLKNEQKNLDNNSETEIIDIEDNNVDEDVEPLVSSNRNVITADTENRILKKLSSFENSEKFLKKDLTISHLAAQLSTNSKYLSEIIKNHRAQNFSNYINSLRINFIIHKLYNEPKYREYKISYLAEYCGYASPQVFVLAFRKINGVTPSYFVSSLKDDAVMH